MFLGFCLADPGGILPTQSKTVKDEKDISSIASELQFFLLMFRQLAVSFVCDPGEKAAQDLFNARKVLLHYQKDVCSDFFIPEEISQELGTDWKNKETGHTSLEPRFLPAIKNKDMDLLLISKRDPGFELAIQRLLDSLGGLNWDLDDLEVLSRVSDVLNKPSYLKSIIRVAKSASQMMDIRIRDAFFQLLKTGFSNLPSLELQREMLSFYLELHGTFSIMKFDDNCKQQVRHLLKKLPCGSHTENLESVAKICHKAAWYFLANIHGMILNSFSIALENSSAICPLLVVNLSKLRFF